VAPSRSIRLTGRDRQILDTLAVRVRFLSAEQIARTWWDGSSVTGGVAVERLRALARAGMIELRRMMLRPELPLSRPLAVWRPGDDPPDLGRVAGRAQRRWTEAPRATLAAMLSGPAAKALTGQRPRRPRAGEATHDLHVAAVYLWYRSRRPVEAATWTTEDGRAAKKTRAGQVVPDAAVRERGGGMRLVDFAGEYRRDKLERFHAYCSARELPYELW
jgi:hypothetical protein